MASGNKKRNAEIDARNTAINTAIAKQTEKSPYQQQREAIYSDILTNGPKSKYAQPNVSQLALYKRNTQERDRAGAYGFGARYADRNLLAALGSQEEANAAESDAINAENMYQNRFNEALQGGLNEDQLMAQKYASVVSQNPQAREASPWSTALTAGLGIGSMFFSDASLKHSIKPVKYGLREVMELNPVEWKWNSNDQNEMGLIAQDVLKVLPELVGYMDETGLLGIRYAGLLPVMLKAMQEQNEMINSLQERLKMVEENK